jgi:hypothetical protein
MRQIAFFLTHNFKPLFRRTLANMDAGMPPDYDAMVLLDDRNEAPADLGLRKIPVAKCRRRPSAFDPLGQAHNFYIDLINKTPSILESYDYFWIVENDAYFHGSMAEFFSAHDPFDTDLLVPEYGHRDPKWCWLHSAEGIEVTPCGVTAVIYRASRRLMKSLTESISEGISAHMEVLLPHLCMREGMSIRQFIPDLVSICNTYSSPIMGLIEKELSEGGRQYAQRKLYHPVKS